MSGCGVGGMHRGTMEEFWSSENSLNDIIQVLVHLSKPTEGTTSRENPLGGRGVRRFIIYHKCTTAVSDTRNRGATQGTGLGRPMEVSVTFS